MGCLEPNLSSSWVVFGCCSGTAIPRGARTPVAAPIGILICMLTSLKFRVLSTSSTRGVQSLTSREAQKDLSCARVYRNSYMICDCLIFCTFSSKDSHSLSKMGCLRDVCWLLADGCLWLLAAFLSSDYGFGIPKPIFLTLHFDLCHSRV